MPPGGCLCRRDCSADCVRTMLPGNAPQPAPVMSPSSQQGQPRQDSGEDALQYLLRTLQVLPGVGQRSAQRMALHLLERNRNGARELAAALQLAMSEVRHCRQCRNLAVTELCGICRNQNRDQSLCCVVETPADVMALEHAGIYSGRYFVLLGRLSPLDGIGPEQIGMAELEQQLAANLISELIVATNASIEGEATAHYIRELASRHQVELTRIAQGVPSGGDLEYVDKNTLALAFNHRLPMR